MGMPMSFKDIFGQEKQVSFLKGAMEKGRLSHAYLFSGIEGVGKRTVAGIFAKALNCADGQFDACDCCPACLKIERTNHSDVMLLKPEGQFIRIQDIREIQNQMRFRPFEGRARVFIIIDAERMNIAAANALLKTLEEPSPGNILILLSARPHQLPMTIISRCQQLRFSPLSRTDVAAYLMAKLNLDKGTAAVLAASSAGSIGRAIEMHKDSYLCVRDGIIEQIVRCRKDEPMRALAVVDAMGKERGSILQGLDILRGWYRDVLVYRETGEAERLIHRDRLAIVTSFATGLSVSEVLENVTAIDKAVSAIERNANKQLTLETLLFKLTHPFS